MAKELYYERGVPWSLHFTFFNALVNATNVMTRPGGSQDYLVPSGMAFYAVHGDGASNTDLTAGTCTFKVTANNAAIAIGPQPALSDTVQAATAQKRFGESVKITAGQKVGAHAVANASFAPNNAADLDFFVFGYLVPDPTN